MSCWIRRQVPGELCRARVARSGRWAWGLWVYAYSSAQRGQCTKLFLFLAPSISIHLGIRLWQALGEGILQISQQLHIKPYPSFVKCLQVKSIHKQQTTIRKPIECAPEASSGGRGWAELTEGFHLEVTRHKVLTYVPSEKK